jgi:hypothetical protein
MQNNLKRIKRKRYFEGEVHYEQKAYEPYTHIS